MSQKNRWLIASILGALVITFVLVGNSWLNSRKPGNASQKVPQPTQPQAANTATPAGSAVVQFKGEMLIVSSEAGKVYLAQANEMKMVSLGSDDVHEPAPVLSPDGSRIAFRDVNGALNLFDLNENQTSTYTEFMVNGSPALGWSPDSSRVVYGCPTLISDLCSFDPSAGQSGQYTQADQNQAGYGGYRFAGWSADGAKLGLVYWQAPKNQAELEKSYYIGSLYVLDAKSKKLTLAFSEDKLNGAKHLLDAALSPDGKTFLFSALVGDRYAIFRVNSDGSGLAQLTVKDLGFSVVHPIWSPDGKYFVASAPERSSTGETGLNQPTIFDLKGKLIGQIIIPGGGEASSWISLVSAQ